jgi:hypothetical protein
MLCLRRGDDLAAGGNNVGREEGVAGHPQVPAAESPAATKRQSGDPDRGTAPTGEVDAIRLEPGANVCITRTSGDRYRIRRGIDTDRTHPLDVDDQPVRVGKPGVGMPTRAHRKWRPGSASPPHAGRCIFRRSADGDAGRTGAHVAGSVDHCRRRVHRVPGAEEPAAEAAGQIVPGGIAERGNWGRFVGGRKTLQPGRGNEPRRADAGRAQQAPAAHSPR